MSRATWIAITVLLAAIGAIASPLVVKTGTTRPAEPNDDQLLAMIDPAKATDYSVLRASVTPADKLFFAGKAVWVDFELVNQSDKPVLVKVPFQVERGERAAPAVAGVRGLPLEHLFTRKGAADDAPGRRALVIHPVNNPIEEVDEDVTYQPTGPVAPIVIRPRGVVGRRLDLAAHYPHMTRPGRYLIQWRPYNDAVRSPVTEITIMTEEHAILETDLGNIELSFFYDKAPNHVENFLDLARRGFYDGCQFHRVIEGFMIQGGDPLTKDPRRVNQWGTGVGPRMLKQEFNNTAHVPGVLSMARGPDVNSASCQFFIVTGNAGFLDGQYSAFGRTVDDQSLKVATKISKAPRNEQDRPLTAVVIRKVRVVPVGGPPATQPGA